MFLILILIAVFLIQMEISVGLTPSKDTDFMSGPRFAKGGFNLLLGTKEGDVEWIVEEILT